MSKHPLKKYTQWLVGLIAAYLTLAAVINTSIDPWRIIDAPWSIQSLDPWRDPSEVVRTGKAAFANRGDLEVVAIGSSRIEIAIDPTHAAFDGKRSINLAMAAANIYETVPVANYTIDRNPDLETIIFGIEAGDLYNKFDSRTVTDFYQSPFYENSPLIERTVNQVIGAGALNDSIATIQQAIKKATPERNELGLWIKPKNPLNIKNYMEALFEKGFINSFDEWEATSRDFKPSKAALLEGLIARCQAEGIQLYIVIPPQHALKLLHPTENYPKELPWELDLKKLIAICKAANNLNPDAPQVQLWDFSIFSDWTTEPLPSSDETIQRMDNWFDFGHAKPVIGNEILNTLFYGTTSTRKNIGVNLLETPWEQFKYQWIQQHAEYVQAQSADVEWRRGWVAPKE